MIVNALWPTSSLFGGGLSVVFEFCNILARQGHEVHFLHGPATPHRIDHPDEISWFDFDPRIVHHVIDDLQDPTIVPGDICLSGTDDARLGLPVAVIQGYGLTAPSFDRPAFRLRGPKLCVATWLQEVGVAWGVPADQLLYQPIGIDHEVFRGPSPIADRPVDVAMLYSGHPVKGTADGLAALAEVRRRRPCLKVALFGLLAPVEPLPEWVTFHNGLDRPGLVREVYGRSKVFVQPSWLEGFGLPAVEAMACGAALVTTDNGGSRDYAVADETAVVVPPRSVDDLADAIEALLVDADRRHQIAAAGEQFVRRFTWERAGDQLAAHLSAYLADPERFGAEAAEAPMVPLGWWSR